jgi:hypothetical protein
MYTPSYLLKINKETYIYIYIYIGYLLLFVWNKTHLNHTNMIEPSLILTPNLNSLNIIPHVKGLTSVLRLQRTAN